MAYKGEIQLRFFTRCKILYGFFMFFCICTGGILFVRLFPHMNVDSGDFVFIGIFLFLIVCLIMLKCIIKDAEEDLAALAKLKDGTGTHFGDQNTK